MKLLTKEILQAFIKQGDTSEKKAEDIKIICKFFNPTGAGTWYCFEYNPEDRIFDCFALLNDPQFAELGSISMDEIESYKGAMGLGIERDMYYPVGKKSLREVMDKVKGVNV